MKKLIVIIVIVIVALVAVLSHGADTDETIKVGALLCLSGGCAEWGENSLRGIELAIAELNANGDTQYELVVQDSDEISVANAVSGYQHLRRSGVAFIIGPSWTPAGLALHPIASEDEVLIVSPSLGVAEFNEAASNIFNTWTHDAIATEALAERAHSEGLRRAAVFSSKQAWEQTQGEVFAEAFERLGGDVVIHLEPHAETEDLRTDATKVVAASPDVVIFSNFAHMGIAAKELRNLGYEGAQLSVLMDESRVEVAQGALEGTVYAQYPAAAESFVDRYVAAHNEEPGITADTAYDAMMIIDRGVQEAGTTKAADVIATMNTFEMHTGASGEMIFDGLGGVVRDPVFWTVKDGAFIEA